MSNIEWLAGYLEGISKLNSVYGSDSNCYFEITPVKRKQTPTESIIAANESWEGKYLSHCEYTIENKKLSYLKGRIDHWFLTHVINIMFYANVENPYKTEEIVKKSNRRKIGYVSGCFLGGLEKYFGESFEIFEYRLSTYTKKSETPRDYCFDFLGDQFLIYGSTKALTLSFDDTD